MSTKARLTPERLLPAAYSVAALGYGDITEFLDYVEWYRDFLGIVPLEARADEDAVRLMTVHSAKGREFPHVVPHVHVNGSGSRRCARHTSSTSATHRRRR